MNIKKILISVFLIVIMLTCSVNANTSDSLKKIENTKEYNEWLKLSEDEQRNTYRPRNIKIKNTSHIVQNPINTMIRVGASFTPKYSLKDVIAENVKIKNQGENNSCWTFSMLGALESNLALADYYNGQEVKVYDFSERHMEYATARLFKDGKINEDGFNRTVNIGGSYFVSIPYLTNGMGAIDEKDMPYEDNHDLIDISEIQNKKVVTQVFDTKEFPTYTTEAELTELKNSMKEFIKEYGGIDAPISGANVINDYFNIETGALFCDDEIKCPVDHDVEIIGWDDNYSVDNFVDAHKPQNNGAWIIRNSWGENLTYKYQEYKEAIFNTYKNENLFVQNGIDSIDKFSDELFNNLLDSIGYGHDDNYVYIPLGDNGYMYISYEDVNVYKYLSGIEKAANSVNYDNIYQYNNYGYSTAIQALKNDVYLANIFEKKSNKKEYLTQVSLNVIETVTCNVYVNVNGKSTNKNDLTKVKLKAGDSETFDAGYHTLEFAEPIEIKSNEFAVVVEMKGTLSDLYIPIEAMISEDSWYKYVETENNKCLVAVGEEDFENNTWEDLGSLGQTADLINGDSTIKAFTVFGVDEDKNKEEEQNDKVEITDFSKAKASPTYFASYVFKELTNTDYMLIDLDITNINRSTKNDSMEYYYYLSSDSSLSNITDWIKISEKQDNNDKISFRIDTRKCKNYEELLKAENLYLYVKEVATKGNLSSNNISSALKVENKGSVDVYIDNKKEDSISVVEEKNNSNVSQTDNSNNSTTNNSNNSQNSNTQESSSSIQSTTNIPAQKTDTTVSNTVLPKTGKQWAILGVIAILIGIAIVKVYKYKKIQLK